MSDKKTSPTVTYETIRLDEASQRVDNFLRTRLKGVPKGHIYRLIRKGQVRVNKGRISPDYKLKAGDIVRIPPVRVAQNDTPALSGYWAKQLSQAVLRETDSVLFLNKPPGLAVHGGSGLQTGLIEQLRLARQDRYLELAHRLDRETSGVIVIAKKRSTLREIQANWQSDTLQKTYQALVVGHYKGPSKIEAPLASRLYPNGERRSVVAPDGKPAVSLVKVLEQLNGATLVEVTLLTGRMHQIRCHLAYMGYPIIGDSKYGNFAENTRIQAEYGYEGLALHAARINWPEREWAISAPLPPAFETLLAQLSPRKDK